VSAHGQGTGDNRHRCRILGDLYMPSNTQVVDLIDWAARNPNSPAAMLPSSLRVGGRGLHWHMVATIAEAVHVRWLDVADALGNPDYAQKLASLLCFTGWTALAPRFEIAEHPWLVDHLGSELADILTTELHDQVYLVPRTRWRARMIEPMRQDIDNEVGAAREWQNAAAWQPCPQRLDLFCAQDRLLP